MKALLRLQYYMSGGRWGGLFLAGFPFLLALLPYPHVPDASFHVLMVTTLGSFLGLVQTVMIDNAESVSHWRSYAKSLPYSREQLVDAKYLFSLLCAGEAALLGALMLPLLMLRNPEAVSVLPYAPSAAELSLMNAALASAGVLAAAAFLYPSYFRRSGRLISYVLGFLIFFFVFMFFVPFRLMMALTRCKWEPLTSSMHLVPYLLLAGSVICCLLSWLYTRKTYCRRKRRRAA